MRSPTTHSRPGRSIGSGIGLVLSLVVMLIVMAMYFGSFGGRSYMQNVAASRKQAIQTVHEVNTSQILTCFTHYKLQNGRLPRTVEELDVQPVSMLWDQWRQPMTFSYRTEREGPTEVTWVIWRSAGPDLQMNTQDDILKQDRLPF